MVAPFSLISVSLASFEFLPSRNYRVSPLHNSVFDEATCSVHANK